MKKFALTTALAGAAIAASAQAQEFDVIGGSTSVLLDTALLSSAAGLDLFGTVGDVLPGDLGMGSVAFPINARDGSLPTTFSYDAGLASFSGAIEHEGGVQFNDGAVTVGDFTIGFDAGRVAGDNSGFFVESTLSIAAILFDVQLKDPAPIADASDLIINADLVVSPEFAAFLGDAGLTGADVGDAQINAIVPAPATAAVLGITGLAAIRRRR